MPNWVGDATMATPTLRSIGEHFGSQCEMTLVMQPVVADLMAGSPWCNEPIVFAKNRWGRIGLIQKLRSTRADAILLLTNSLWTAMVAKLAGIPRRIGYARDGRGWLLTERLPALKSNGRFAPVPAVDYYLKLAEHLGCDIRDRRMSLCIQPSDIRMADALWTSIGFSSNRPVVVINSSGASGSSKLWPADHVEQLARRLVDNHSWQVLLHCGPAERAAADAVATRINHRRVQSMGRAETLPIGLTKAVLARAAAVVTTDSGPRHIAIAFNRPVVSLFGPTDPAWTITYNRPEARLEVKMPCRSCWKHSCPLGHHRCMRDLGIETVYGRLLAAMVEGDQRAAA